MPYSCVVVGCAMRKDERAKASKLGFFRIPKEQKKRRLWIAAINRKNWKPADWERVCGRHFVSGRSSSDRNNVDYCPTLYMKGIMNDTAAVTDNEHSEIGSRQLRAMKRNERSFVSDLAEVCMKYPISMFFDN